jgi:hypothetical protein
MSGAKNKSTVAEPVLQQVRESLLRSLAARFPERPDLVEISQQIEAQADLETLLRWYEAVAVAKSLAEVRAALGLNAEGLARPSVADSSWQDRAFYENRAKYPREKLLGYAGQYIAWSRDGTDVLASDPDEAGLYRKLHAGGIDIQRVVIDYAGDGEVSYL